MKKYIKFKIKLDEKYFHRLKLVDYYNDEIGKHEPYWELEGKKVGILDTSNIRVCLGWFYDNEKAISTKSCGYAYDRYFSKYYKESLVYLELTKQNSTCEAAFSISIQVDEKHEIKNMLKFIQNMPVNKFLNNMKELGFWFKDSKKTKAEIRRVTTRTIVKYYNLDLLIDCLR